MLSLNAFQGTQAVIEFPLADPLSSTLPCAYGLVGLLFSSAGFLYALKKSRNIQFADAFPVPAAKADEAKLEKFSLKLALDHL